MYYICIIEGSATAHIFLLYYSFIYSYFIYYPFMQFVHIYVNTFTLFPSFISISVDYEVDR